MSVASTSTFIDPVDKTYIWPVPEKVRETEPVNLLRYYLKYYEQTKYTHDWFYVILNAAVIYSFERAMDADKGISRTLRFSCRTLSDPDYLRHYIVVSPVYHFTEKIWPSIKAPDVQDGYKYYEPINSSDEMVDKIIFMFEDKERDRIF